MCLVRLQESKWQADSEEKVHESVGSKKMEWGEERERALEELGKLVRHGLLFAKVKCHGEVSQGPCNK